MVAKVGDNANIRKMLHIAMVCKHKHCNLVVIRYMIHIVYVHITPKHTLTLLHIMFIVGTYSQCAQQDCYSIAM